MLGRARLTLSGGGAESAAAELRQSAVAAETLAVGNVPVVGVLGPATRRGSGIRAVAAADGAPCVDCDLQARALSQHGYLSWWDKSLGSQSRASHGKRAAPFLAARFLSDMRAAGLYCCTQENTRNFVTNGSLVTSTKSSDIPRKGENHLCGTKIECLCIREGVRRVDRRLGKADVDRLLQVSAGTARIAGIVASARADAVRAAGEQKTISSLLDCFLKYDASAGCPRFECLLPSSQIHAARYLTCFIQPPHIGSSESASDCPLLLSMLVSGTSYSKPFE